ncbi:MAG TPA: DUF4012 domain-containing protein [Ktedonosporobacter sp.]|nr:DUF4012 domain-containing protein [Ktedonosporobacter sp.]
MSDYTTDSDSSDPYDIIAEAQQIAARAQASAPLAAVDPTTVPGSLAGPLEIDEAPQEQNSGPIIIDNSAPTLLPNHPTGPLPAFHQPRYFRLLNRRQSQRRHGRFSDLRLASIVLLLLLLLGIATPLVLAASYGLNAYSAYTTIRAHATNGFQYLQAVKALFTGSSSNPTGALDAHKLAQAEQDFTSAYLEFVDVETALDQTPALHTISQYLPQYRSQLTSARAASQIGVDISIMGEQAMTLLSTFAPRLHTPLLSTTQTPLLTPTDLQLIDTTIENFQPLVGDIQSQSRQLSLDTLPLNAHQRTQVQQLLQLLPQMATALQCGHTYLAAIGWLLGVDRARTFLIQTMDRAELRATGGFTGQYGELAVNGARIAPFSLHDIALVEYADSSPTYGQLAPDAYRSWWPFANWGLRDSNLSADFPTSARLAINEYKLDTHHQVDGVILFTPLLIEHILQAIGPLHVPKYNETITAQNLEERLHYYQLDNKGIRREELVEHVEDPAQARKLFTSALARALMDEVRHAPPQMLLAIAQELLHDLKTKDLQIYLTNPQLEGLLQQYGDAAQIDRSTTHDGFYIVQTNVSASKASQYVQTIVHDTVNLDASGGATHTLQLRLVYNQTGPVYGLDTYRDYIRFYVPPSAQFRHGNGFDTGTPLCGGPLGPCPAHGIYPHNELVCPAGGYDAGWAAPMLNDPYAGQWHPLDTIGPPTNFHSDEPGRAMFAGYVVIPKNCTMTVTLSWYVPPLGKDAYTLLVQRQAGTFPVLDLTILPPAGVCTLTAGLHFNGTLTEDTSFSPAVSARPHIIRDSPTRCGPDKQV